MILYELNEHLKHGVLQSLYVMTQAAGLLNESGEDEGRIEKNKDKVTP